MGEGGLERSVSSRTVLDDLRPELEWATQQTESPPPQPPEPELSDDDEQPVDMSHRRKHAHRREREESVGGTSTLPKALSPGTTKQIYTMLQQEEAQQHEHEQQQDN